MGVLLEKLRDIKVSDIMPRVEAAGRKKIFVELRSSSMKNLRNNFFRKSLKANVLLELLFFSELLLKRKLPTKTSQIFQESQHQEVDNRQDFFSKERSTR